MKFLVMILGLLWVLPLPLAAKTYEPGDKLYVWAQSGLNLRAAASISGQKIGKLQAGEQVEVIALTTKGYDIVAVDVHPELYVDNIFQEEGSREPFYLHGTWVKVKGAKFEGYVIDSYLLQYAPPVPKTSLTTYFSDLYGETLQVDTTWNIDCDGAEFVDCYSYEGYTQSGFGVRGTYLMSATDHTIVIPDMGVAEAFVLLNYFSPLEDGLRRKKGYSLLKYMGGGEEGIWFLKGEICEFSISVEAGKLYISEGCSC